MTQENRMTPKQRKLQSQMRRLNRRKKVSEMYLRRFTLSQIADTLGVGIGTVQKDINNIKDEWRKESKEHIGEIISRELAELQHIENEAAKQFIRQRDKSFLETRLKCKDRRARLLGLDQPEKHQNEVNVSGGLDIDLANLTDDELDVMEKILERHEDDGK